MVTAGNGYSEIFNSEFFFVTNIGELSQVQYAFCIKKKHAATESPINRSQHNLRKENKTLETIFLLLHYLLNQIHLTAFTFQLIRKL